MSNERGNKSDNKVENKKPDSKSKQEDTGGRYRGREREEDKCLLCNDFD